MTLAFILKFKKKEGCKCLKCDRVVLVSKGFITRDITATKFDIFLGSVVKVLTMIKLDTLMLSLLLLNHHTCLCHIHR